MKSQKNTHVSKLAVVTAGGITSAYKSISAMTFLLRKLRHYGDDPAVSKAAACINSALEELHAVSEAIHEIHAREMLSNQPGGT